jgi:hypothetical protein
VRIGLYVRLGISWVMVVSTAMISAQSTTSSIPVNANPDFDAVAAKLDQRGSSFHYTDASGFLDWLFETAEPLTSVHPMSKQISDAAKAGLTKLGLAEINDFGSSTFALGGGLVREKGYLHLKNRSGLFSLAGPEPGELSVVKFIPADASAAWCGNLECAKVLPLARSAMEAGTGPMGKAIVDQGMASAIKETGVDIEKVAASLGNEWGIHFKLSPELLKTGALLDDAMDQFRFVFRQEVADGQAFAAAKAFAAKNEAKIEDVKSESGMQVVKISPRQQGEKKETDIYLASAKDWLIVTNSLEELKRSEEAAASGKSIWTSEEFKKLRSGMPDKVNGFGYIAEEYLTSYRASMIKTVESLIENETSSEQRKQFKAYLDGGVKVAESLGLFSGSISWWVNDPHGIQLVSVRDSRQPTMSAPTVATAGIAVAVAVPAFLRARENARGRACQHNLSMIDGAKEQYALEKRLRSGTTVTMDQLVGEENGYLKRTPVCPAGGMYNLGDVGSSPNCSYEAPSWAVSHQLPE